MLKLHGKKAFRLIKDKVLQTSKDKICGLVGDMINMEASYCFKELLSKVLQSNNYESRTDYSYLDSRDRKNYLFNTKIKSIEESDLIILIGTNPRLEATILNSRIRKAFINNKTEIFSMNDVGDLTYPYKLINGDTETIKNISEDNHELSEKIKNSTKPLIIFGQSSLLLKSFGFIFESLKNIF